MPASDDLQRIESELEDAKAHLRQDISQIEQKVQQTRAQLSPTNFIRGNLWLLSGISLALGFVVGYHGVPIGEIAKPAAHNVLSTAGKHAVVRVMRR